MRRLLVAILSISLLLSIFGLSNQTRAAGQYPEKPITFIVPIEAGSVGDTRSRLLCKKASPVLGQQIVVVNKPGAGSTIGYLELRGAKPDGYTIGMGTVTIVTNKLQGLMPYDYHDFTQIGTFYTSPNDVFASTKTKRPFKTIEELISYAKANPRKVSMATGGIGQSIWIGAMVFTTGTGIDVNVIPQEGAGGLVVIQVAGGHVDIGVFSLTEAKPQMDAGNLRFLATLGSKRKSGFENVPTVKELGYNAVWESFGVVMGPPKLPKDISEKLAKAFEVAAKDPEYIQFIESRGAYRFYLSPDQIIPYCDDLRKSVRNVMDKAGILKEK